jgi:glycosyltransferase involved in cell wall biosynthesis
LVLLHPVPQYPEAYPVKMFEYTAASIPVIASDFGLWRKIIEDAKCGILVDPHDPHAIARAVEYLLIHPQEAALMGRREREAAEQYYNWESEKKKLLQLYADLLPSDPPAPEPVPEPASNSDLAGHEVSVQNSDASKIGS